MKACGSDRTGEKEKGYSYHLHEQDLLHCETVLELEHLHQTVHQDETRVGDDGQKAPAWRCSSQRVSIERMGGWPSSRNSWGDVEVMMMQ